MVCPNCKSDDIVLIQNQHYCINCGQLVPATSVAAQTKPAVATPKATVSAAPKATPVSAPKVATKAAVKAAPKPVAAAVAVLDKPKPAPTKSMSDIKQAPVRQPVALKPAITTVAVKTNVPKPSSQSPKVISRLVEAKPRPFEPKDEAPRNVPIAAIKKEAVLGPALQEAANAAWDPKFLSSSLMVAVVRLAPAWLIGVFVVISGNNFTLRVGNSLTDLGLFVVLSLLLHRLLSNLVTTVVTNGIAFGQAKAGDNRPVKPPTWWSAGYNSLPSSLSIDIICQIITAALVALAVFGWGYAPILAARIAVATLVAAVVGLVWLVRILARQTVVLADLKPRAALDMGRRLLAKHFGASLVAGLVSLIATILAIPAYFGAGYAARLITAALGLGNRWIEPAAGTIVSGLYLTSATLFVIVLWVELYRRMVRQLPQKLSASLMTGRGVAPVKRDAASLFAILVIVLLAGYGYLSWQPDNAVGWLRRFL